jgi:RNA polymerase sigma-70 factor (ECF subfamily)
VEYTQLEDNALLKLILVEARADALDQLYSRYGRLVYSVALRIVGERQTAEEITLDVFVKVWEKADTYQPRLGSVRVWVTGMTRNRAIDILRRQSVRLDAQSLRWADLTSQPISKEPNPEATVDLNLRKQRIRRAIAQLPEEQRNVLALAYFQGYTQREIAELCKLPLGTVKSRIRASIQKLRQLLHDERLFNE